MLQRNLVLRYTEQIFILLKARAALLARFHDAGFTSVLVHFALPDEVLAARVASTERSTKVFRSASSFEHVLQRQHAESSQEDTAPPKKTRRIIILKFVIVSKPKPLLTALLTYSVSFLARV
jgi:hypothetical protein